MLPSLDTTLVIEESSDLLGLGFPGRQNAFQLADQPEEHQGQSDSHQEGRKHLADNVERASLEDRVAEPLGGRHELADDRSHKGEAHGELEASEDVGE